MSSTSCEYRDTDVAARYVQGRLAEDEAERFEAHYFACEACWAEVQGGIALRAATSRPAAPARRSFVRRAFPAAAAVVLVAAMGWLVLQDRVEPPPAFRGAETTWNLEAQRGDGAVAVTWSAVPGAVSYRVRIHAPDGTPLDRMEVTGTSARVPVTDFGSYRRVYVTVDAIDAAHLIVDRSPPIGVGRGR
ncbi:MAG: hypothetical protein ACRD2J_04940 [Thermoanaerobaculia bacterium]